MHRGEQRPACINGGGALADGDIASFAEKMQRVQAQRQAQAQARAEAGEYLDEASIDDSDLGLVSYPQSAWAE